ncbi:MAG: right-handed parallel beta-helix repeat-containing protein [Candidatus Omnitrophica bacterium]|nr:right-handed parallel beta-helix repeat-containing protein [Candidatus Omnitrophota bacterium]
MPRILLLLIPLLLNVETAPAKTLYVSKSGDGSHGLSWETGFNQISRALIESVTNDVIRLSAEVYRENLIVATPVTIIGGYVPGVLIDEGSPSDYSTIESANESRFVFQISHDSILKRLRVTKGRGGIKVSDCRAMISECVVENNGSFGSIETGILSISADLTMENCEISRNEAAGFGAGVRAVDSRVQVIGSTFFKNIGHDIPGHPGIGIPHHLGKGAGLHLEESQAVLANCLLFENEAPEGADIYLRNASIHCVNCTFASTKYPPLFKDESTTTTGPTGFINCIVWGHATSFQGEGWTVCHSNVRGGHLGEGNLDSDPVFLDATNYNYELERGSPCIDSGTDTEITTDLDGNPRPVDVLGIGLDGPGAYDMGCYEFQLKKSDLTRDGKVDAEDLLMFQEEWMREGE